MRGGGRGGIKTAGKDEERCRRPRSEAVRSRNETLQRLPAPMTACSLQQTATCSLQPAACSNLQPATCNLQPAACSLHANKDLHASPQRQIRTSRIQSLVNVSTSMLFNM